VTKRQVLYQIGLPTIAWFADPHWSMVLLVAYSIWHEVGFTVLIMLAGLTNINKEVREAARIASPKMSGFSRLL